MNQTDPRTDFTLHIIVKIRWVQSFVDRYQIVSRAYTDKRLVSA